MPIISRPGFFDSASIENLTIETQLLLQAASETYGVAISHSEQSADRTITIPALAGNGDMVITNAVQTLTNKTITNLKLSEILDTNGNELFKFTTTSSAVNEITLANAAASNAPVFSATGGDTNIDIKLQPKGSGKVQISGGLQVDGTTTTVNSTTITVDDPIFTLGGDTAPGSDDNKDRGIEFRYHDGSSARIGFFGFDDSTGKFTALTAATNSSEVFSGTAMPAIFGNVEAATISGTTGTFTGVVDITDTTDSSDATGDTGALRTEGGASIAKKLYVGTDADIDGTLEADAITVDGTALNEFIADTVGAMVTSNTESGITVAYQDGDNTLDFTIGTLNQDTTGTAAIATTVTITDNESTNENNAIIFTAGGDIDGGNLGLESDGTLTYNPSTGSITATGFIGALTGNASTATEATNITAVANNSTDETVYLTFVDGVTGTQGIETDSGLTYNPSTGVLTTTSVTGNLTGNVTGNTSGSAATVTGAAQSSITSLGTLTTLTVDSVIINGTTIGHTSDTDLITVADGLITVAGEISVTTLDIGGTNIGSTAAELNLLDGSAKSTSSITIADSDAFVVIDGTTTKQIPASDIKTYAAAGAGVASDDISTGDGAVNIVTTSGNITIDAQANDTDVIIKVDDNGSSVTAVTFDGSDEGNAIFVNDIQLKSDSAVLKFGTDLDTTLTHTDGTGLTLNSTNKLTFGDTGTFIHQSSDGVLTIESDTTVDINGAVALNGAITGATNITLSGELDAATLDLSGAADIAGDLVLSGGADGALQFTNAGENSIKIPDNQASALIIEEADNAYITFTTTDSSEAITVAKNTTFSGIVDITDSTDSSDASGDTGALRTEGGASIAKKLYVGTDADIDGTLEADAITVDGTTLAEYISDTVGAMVTSNTESGITVAYQDADNTLDFTIGTLNQDTTGTAATVTGAAQSAITSLGTLTALTVDDVAINGKVVTMTGSTDDTAVFTVGTNGTLSIVTVDTAAAAANIQITADGTVDIDSAGVLTLDSGAAINIEPASGSAILLDGTISIDAGVVTGATSITSTAFVGDITGDVTGTADVATVATTVTITDNENTNENNAVIFTAGGDVDGGNLGLESDGNLTYNPSSGTLTATAFSGALTGNVTGTADVATVATTVTITDNESTDEDNAIIFTAGGDVDGGNIGLESDGNLTYNPSTGRLTATQLAGTLQTASQTNITGVGTISTGVWQGTAIASAYLDADTAHLSGTQTFSGAKTFTSTITVGVDDTGQDVKFFGASAGAYMEWDESADQLRIMGASADATTSTGKLLLATSLTDINANDVLGKIDFQAPHEAGGTDAITVAASIQAIAQGTFSASVNATDLVFYTGHSEAATEKFRFTSQGEIGVGGANYGTDGQVLTSGGAGAAPAWEDASGGGTLDFVADGAIANGDAVALNSDGTISPCDDSTTTTTASTFGTVTASNKFTTNTCNTLLAVWEDNANKVVFVWRDESDSNKGKSVVGTVSGDTISYGSIAEVDDGQIRFHGICFDSSNNRVVASYYDADNSNQGTAIVGTVSGTSISWGTAVVYDSGYTPDAAVVFDSNSNKVVIGFRNYGGDGDAKGIVGTVSGTGISFGSASSAFESGTTYYLNGTFDSNLNKVVFVFADENNSMYGTSVVGTVSGTDVTFGSQVVFESARGDYIGATFDSDNNKVVITYQDTGNSNHGTAIVGTVSGTSISYGTAVVFAAASSARMAYGTVYDTNINKVIVVFSDAANSGYPTGVIGTVSGTSISFTAETTFESAYNIHPSTVFDSTNNKLIIAQAGNSTVDGAAIVATPTAGVSTTTYNTTNFIGVAAAAISDTATGSINIMGSVNESLTSLTVGAKYYLQVNGTIATTATDKEIGRAIASTKLLITKAQAASGGGMNFIASSGALSGVASVSFTQFNSSLYDNYVFFFQNIIGVTDDTHFVARVSTDGGNNYDSDSNYRSNGNSDTTYAYVVASTGSSANELAYGEFWVYAPHQATYTFMRNAGTNVDRNGNVYPNGGSSYPGNAAQVHRVAADVDGIQFLFASGNIEVGEIVMYGIKSV